MNNTDTMKQVYLLAQKYCGLKIGDWVKVTRCAEKNEAGWDGVCLPEQNQFVGLIGKIYIINHCGICVDFKPEMKDREQAYYFFPYFVLEKVEKPTHQFKPFDKVLMRDEDSDVWIPALFGHYATTGDYCKTHPYVQIGHGSFKQCIPYNGNEHLVGTTDMPVEK